MMDRDYEIIRTHIIKSVDRENALVREESRKVKEVWYLDREHRETVFLLR